MAAGASLDAGAGVADGAAAWDAGVDAEAAGLEVSAPQAATASMSAARAGRNATRDGRRLERVDTEAPPVAIDGTGGARHEDAKPLASTFEVRGQVVGCTVLPTFLSKARACTVESATGLPPEGAVTVAGLCRNRTGFATTRR